MPDQAPEASSVQSQRLVDRAFWFGTLDRPLAGRLHFSADGSMRGGVVICPGLGWDRAVGYLSLRMLAKRLATDGLAVLQFDYDGTGESYGSDSDPDRLGAWTASIVAACQKLHQCGVHQVSLVGLRYGATLAAEAAAAADAADVVLWDPIVSGKRFVRMLRAWDRLHGLPRDPGTMAIAGMALSQDTVAALAALDLSAPTVPTLAVLPPGSPVPASLGSASVIYRDGQSELMDGDTITARPPQQTIADIADWILAQRHADLAQEFVPPRAEPSVVDHVSESFVTLAGMEGTETSPDRPSHPDAPTIVMINNAAETRVGPGRAWREWARTLAQHGIRSLRMDLTGIGDSPARPDAPSQLAFGPHSVPDIQALIEHCDTGTGVALVGLCSGGRNALDAALEAGSSERVRLLVLLNPTLIHDRHLLEQVTMDNPLPNAIAAANAYHRVRHNIVRRTPGLAWRMLSASGLHKSQVEGLRQVLKIGARVLLVYTEDDFNLFKLRQSAQWAVKDLQKTGRFCVQEIKGTDHPLFSAPGRRAVLDVLTSYITALYPSTEPGFIICGSPDSVPRDVMPIISQGQT